MKFLANLSIKMKLVLMLVFPVAGLVFFSTQGIWAKYTVSREMGDIQQVSRLAVRISALVHEMQKERGMTAGYLGSQGAKFASELPAQRSQTDKQIDELKTFVTGFESSSFGEEFEIGRASCRERV